MIYKTLQQAEDDHIRFVVEHTLNLVIAAEMLDIGYNTLWRKLKKYPWYKFHTREIITRRGSGSCLGKHGVHTSIRAAIRDRNMEIPNDLYPQQWRELS